METVANGCSTTPVEEDLVADGVVLVGIRDMDHRWPDAADGYGFRANEAVVEFFLRHSN